MNNNRNKITFKKILVNKKLGYNNIKKKILEKLIEFKKFLFDEIIKKILLNTSIKVLYQNP